jgi:HSP20 family molecular chaperone IbpA
MSRIPVKTVNSARKVLNHLTRLMKSVYAEIHEQALQRRRQQGEGYELEDWLAAERDVLYSPPCILTESHDLIHVQAAVPLVNAKSLQVDVLPESITIEGRMLVPKSRPGDRIWLREFGGEQLLRQFDLPARIDPKYARATLENGVLDITAKKAVMTVAQPVVEEIKSVKHSAA